MTMKDIYKELKAVLPPDTGLLMDHEFPRWRTEAVVNPEDFKNRLADFLCEHIGISASNPLSVKVFAILGDRDEEGVYLEFKENGYK